MLSFFAKSFVCHLASYRNVLGHFCQMDNWMCSVYWHANMSCTNLLLLYSISNYLEWSDCTQNLIRHTNVLNNAFLTRLRHITINMVLCFICLSQFQEFALWWYSSFVLFHMFGISLDFYSSWFFFLNKNQQIFKIMQTSNCFQLIIWMSRIILM